MNIEFTSEQCIQLLEKCGYVTEEVMLYYKPRTSPYEDDDYSSENLMGIKEKVVYQKNKKPDALNKDFPLIRECEEYLYRKAVDSLVSRLLFKSIMYLMGSRP
jgi:hypothetical protein